jgi:hypothetical protein
MNPCSLVGLRNSGTFLPYAPRSYARAGLLPINAKFPHDSFERVVAAAGAGNPAEDFLLAPKFTRPFSRLYQGWNEAKIIMSAKMFSAMGVWTSLEPPQPQPPPQEGSPLSSRPCIILEDGLRSIHREGPRRAMPH